MPIGYPKYVVVVSEGKMVSARSKWCGSVRIVMCIPVEGGSSVVMSLRKGDRLADWRIGNVLSAIASYDLLFLISVHAPGCELLEEVGSPGGDFAVVIRPRR